MKRRASNTVGTLSILLIFAAATGSASAATLAPCSPAVVDGGGPTASSALFVLQAAVGIPGLCGPCGCDVTADDRVSVLDAFLTLKRALDSSIELKCLECRCPHDARTAVGTSPRSVILRDIDGDGRDDLITANTKSHDISVRLGLGRGRFGEIKSFWVGETPLSVTLVDLNRDGIDDAITTNALPGNLSILLGNGDGSFGSFDQNLVVSAGLSPINARPADVDGDDIIDLVVANSLSHNISVLLGNGDATFRSYDRTPVGRGPRWVEVADLDGDGIVDIVTANRDSNDLSILRGIGDGTFEETERIGVAEGPYQIVIDDLNGDGLLDLIVPSTYALGVSVFLANHDGGFAQPTFYNSQGYAITATVADFDGNGTADVAVGNFNGSVAVFAGVGDGTLTATGDFTARNGVRHIVATDADEDGILDLVVAASKTGDVIVLRGLGDGRFEEQIVSRAAPFGVALEVADFDADGHPDIALAGRRNWFSSHLGDGSGRFRGAVREPTLKSPRELFAADLDGDANTDILSVNQERWFDEYDGEERLRPGVSYRLGLGDGSFGEELVVADLHARHLDVGDIDRDGSIDFVARDEDIGRLVLYHGLGAQGFARATELDIDPAATAFKLGDLGDDSLLDLVFLMTGEDRVAVASGNTDAGFDAPRSYRVGDGPRALAIGDVNADGFSDVVVTNWTSNDVSTLLGDATGRLAPEIRSSVNARLSGPVLHDLDRDGALDLVAMDGAGVVALRGDGVGGFGLPQLLVLRVPGDARPGYASAFAVADFDSDGQLDIVTVNNVKHGYSFSVPSFRTVPRAGECLPH